MKKYVVRMMMALMIAISFTAAADAQIVVKIRPVAPVLRARPLAPSPAHVWVGGNYVWRGGQYVYEEGYWATPPRRGSIWIEGHWKHRRGGWVWVPGHWRRR
ncbi:YXWGXW repeat-containing protein [Ferruginibacter profundus]